MGHLPESGLSGLVFAVPCQSPSPVSSLQSPESFPSPSPWAFPFLSMLVVPSLPFLSPPRVVRAVAAPVFSPSAENKKCCRRRKTQPSPSPVFPFSSSLSPPTLSLSLSHPNSTYFLPAPTTRKSAAFAVIHHFDALCASSPSPKSASRRSPRLQRQIPAVQPARRPSSLPSLSGEAIQRVELSSTLRPAALHDPTLHRPSTIDLHIHLSTSKVPDLASHVTAHSFLHCCTGLLHPTAPNCAT
ncbi:hypothetical protein G7046_g2165 [Stylonectria norvegica]|nr:hypothetical protein G7046_g2165 [Stylonectria norvegica]